MAPLATRLIGKKRDLAQTPAAFAFPKLWDKRQKATSMINNQK